MKVFAFSLLHMATWGRQSAFVKPYFLQAKPGMKKCIFGASQVQCTKQHPHVQYKGFSYCTNNISVNKCNMFVLPITGLKNNSETRLWLTVWRDKAAWRRWMKRTVSSGYRRWMTSLRALWASCWRPSMNNKALSPWTAATDQTVSGYGPVTHPKGHYNRTHKKSYLG